MKKNPKIFIGHILDSIKDIENYTHHTTKEKFVRMKMIQDAIIRRVNISTVWKTIHTDIPKLKRQMVELYEELM